jgi:hypothetical protein
MTAHPLPVHQNSLSTKTTLPELSPGLNGLLYAERSDDRAKAELLMAPVLLAEAEAALPALQRKAVASAGQDGVRRVIGAAFARYRQPQRSEGEWSLWWADYYDLLADLPEGALQAGMRAWKAIPSHENPQAQFLPSPADLRHLAVSTPNRDVVAFTRARAAVEHVPARVIEPVDMPDITPRIMRQEPTAQQKAAVRRMFEDYAAQHAAKHVDAKPAFKASPVPTDDVGVSFAMRELQSRTIAGR